MAKFDDFVSEVKSGAKDILQPLAKDLTKQAVDDTRAFLDKTEKDLKRWAGMLAIGELTKLEFKDLVRGQKALLKLHSLTEAGIAATKIERARTRLVNLVIDTAFKIFLA